MSWPFGPPTPTQEEEHPQEEEQPQEEEPPEAVEQPQKSAPQAPAGGDDELSERRDKEDRWYSS